jgi:hypothetical protein
MHPGQHGPWRSGDLEGMEAAEMAGADDAYAEFVYHVRGVAEECEGRKTLLFLKKEAKNVRTLPYAGSGNVYQIDKSLFASFSSEKEESSFPSEPLAWMNT